MNKIFNHVVDLLIGSYFKGIQKDIDLINQRLFSLEQNQKHNSSLEHTYWLCTVCGKVGCQTSHTTC